MSIYSILVVALIAILVSNVSAFAPNNNFARRITRSALEMKSSGKVKFFDVVKGFGFITPSDGSPDVFVHQTAIHSQGFRSLAEGESVEYDVVEDKQRGKSSAANVTGPNGAFVQGAPRRESSFGGGRDF